MGIKNIKKKLIIRTIFAIIILLFGLQGYSRYLTKEAITQSRINRSVGIQKMELAQIV